jgi:hypothetical protein
MQRLETAIETESDRLMAGRPVDNLVDESVQPAAP